MRGWVSEWVSEWDAEEVGDQAPTVRKFSSFVCGGRRFRKRWRGLGGGGGGGGGSSCEGLGGLGALVSVCRAAAYDMARSIIGWLVCAAMFAFPARSGLEQNVFFFVEESLGEKTQTDGGLDC